MTVTPLTFCSKTHPPLRVKKDVCCDRPNCDKWINIRVQQHDKHFDILFAHEDKDPYCIPEENLSPLLRRSTLTRLTRLSKNLFLILSKKDDGYTLKLKNEVSTSTLGFGIGVGIAWFGGVSLGVGYIGLLAAGAGLFLGPPGWATSAAIVSGQLFVGGAAAAATGGSIAFVDGRLQENREPSDILEFDPVYLELKKYLPAPADVAALVADYI